MQKSAIRYKIVGKMSATLAYIKKLLYLCIDFTKIVLVLITFEIIQIDGTPTLGSDGRVFYSIPSARAFMSRVTSEYRLNAREFSECPVMDAVRRLSPVALYTICAKVRRARWLLAIS